MSSDKLIGPALPPTFREEGSESDESENDCKKAISNLVPSHQYCISSGLFQLSCVLLLRPVVAGPALPPGYKRGEPSSSSDESEPEVTFKRARTGGASEWVLSVEFAH